MMQLIKKLSLFIDISHATMHFQEDQEELEHITKTELSKYEKERQSTQNLITKDVTEVDRSGLLSYLKRILTFRYIF